MYNRRNFLQMTALAAAGTMLASKGLLAKPAPAALNAVGLQLYTLRDELAKDAKGTIEKVAAAGYAHVETFYHYTTATAKADYWGLTPKELKALLAANNLKTYSGHYQLNDFLTRGNGNMDALKIQLEIAQELGQHYLVVPVPPFMLIDKMKAADYQFMASQMNKAGELCKKAGMQLGYHNHFWEFKTQDNGKTGYDILLSETQKDLVIFELDLFWITKAGFKPTDYFKKYPGRFPMWHVKDMDSNMPNPIPTDSLNHGHVMSIVQSIRYAEVGSGVVDFKDIFAAQKTAGLKHIFVEQDNIYMSDKFESIKQSIDYIKQNLLK